MTDTCLSSCKLSILLATMLSITCIYMSAHTDCLQAKPLHVQSSLYMWYVHLI